MHPQIASITEQTQDRIGYRADSDLDHCAVLDIAGHNFGNRQIGFADLRWGDLDRVARDVMTQL